MRKFSEYFPEFKGDGAVVLDIPVSEAPANLNLDLKTVTDSKPVRINSRDYASASGNLIGIQSKPNSTLTGTADLTGAEFSPRFAAGVNGGNLVAVKGQPLLRGSSGNLSGDFGAFEADLTDSQAAGHTVGGDIYALRSYLNMAAQTVTGDIVPVRIDAAGSTLDWTHILKVGGALGSGGTTNTDKTGNTKSGTLKVKVGGTLYHIQLYANA